MADEGASTPPVTELEAAGVRVRAVRPLHVASLRYFAAGGSFSAAMAAAIGGALPGPLQALTHPGREDSTDLLLAWRSPTETLLLSADDATFSGLERRAAARADGCFVDQTGGIDVWTVTGDRGPDLLRRLGAATSIPAPGEARTGRLAELTVMSLCISAGEIVLLLDRVYSRHLMAWIAETLADF